MCHQSETCHFQIHYMGMSYLGTFSKSQWVSWYKKMGVDMDATFRTEKGVLNHRFLEIACQMIPWDVEHIH